MLFRRARINRKSGRMSGFSSQASTMTLSTRSVAHSASLTASKFGRKGSSSSLGSRFTNSTISEKIFQWRLKQIFSPQRHLSSKWFVNERGLFWECTFRLFEAAERPSSTQQLVENDSERVDITFLRSVRLLRSQQLWCSPQQAWKHIVKHTVIVSACIASKDALWNNWEIRAKFT